MAAPRVAIVVYSMYGHVAKCASVYFIVYYATKHGAAAVAESVKGGLEKAGGAAAIYQYVQPIFPKFTGVANARIRVPETLSSDILTKMHAPAKPDYPIITPAKLTEFDAFIFGIPTRYGNFPTQWKVCMLSIVSMSFVQVTIVYQSFWDATGSLWATGALAGKYAALFVSTGTQGGGQESTALASMSTLAHHG